MSWSPQQQAMLSAMGYTLYRQVGAGVADAPVVSVARDAGVPTQASRATAPASVRPADRLLQALVRAAGGREPGQLPLPPLDQLRASAAAKRALWPVLRALRRQR